MFDFILNIPTWLLDHSGLILRDIVYGFISYWIFKIVLWRSLAVFRKKKQKKKDMEVLEQRIDTLNTVISKTVGILIIVIVVANVLQEVGLSMAPLLAGFSIVGLAFGFGAQGLVKDIVNGMFILAEGQYSKGDIVELADKRGQVEDINLRRTTIRDLEGAIYYIPNSLIGVATNKSQDWASLDIDFPISVKENIDKAMKAIERTAKKLYKDEIFSKFMLEEPRILGVDKILDGKMLIKVVGKTRHLKKWEVAREFRRRVKEEFDKEKISFV